jgi:hypothetical protein
MSDHVMNETSAPTKEMGAFTRMMNIFLAPRQAFESIDRKPDWLIPLVIILLVMVVFTIQIMPIVMPIQMEKQRVKMEERGMSADQIDQAMSMGEKTGKIIGPIAGVVTYAIILLLISGIVLFVGNILMGGKTTFKKIFSVVTYSSLIGTLNQILVLPIILSKKTAEVHFSLATFLPVDNAETLMYQFLKKFDLFAIWSLIVMGIGIAVIYRFTTKKSMTMVTALYVVYMAISLAWFSFTK